MALLLAGWQCECGVTKPGDTVLVVGNDAALGYWNPSCAIALTTAADSWPMWKSAKAVKVKGDGGMMEYKYIIRGSDGVVVWEPIAGNRVVPVERRGVACLLENIWGSSSANSISFVPWNRADSLLFNRTGAGAYDSPPPPNHSPPNNSPPAAMQHNSPPRPQGAVSPPHPCLNGDGHFYSDGRHVDFGGDAGGGSTPSSSSHPCTSSFAQGDCHFPTTDGHIDHRHLSNLPSSLSLSQHYNFRTGQYGPEECSPLSSSYSSCVSAADEAPHPHPRNAIQSNTRGSLRINRGAFILENSGSIAELYTVGDTVGRGTWGEVKTVTLKSTGVRRAAKKIPKCFVEDVERFRQEIRLMKSLDHPNIVRLFESFEDETDIYLVMEYCQGGELFDRLVDEGTFNERSAAHIMRQIVSAIAYCHSSLIAHRDLKPENFLFLNSSRRSPIKLIDFGLASRFAPGHPMHTRAGTPYYVSPEVLEGSYGPECDVWSAGVIMYILLCGYPPFNATSDRNILAKVKSGRFEFPETEWRLVSDNAKDLISRLLDRRTRTRWTAEQTLKHPWFQEGVEDEAWQPAPALTLDIVSKFRRFQGLSRLKKLALTVIAQHLDDQEIEGLKDSFTALDIHRDGVLTIDEIREGIRRSGKRLPNVADLEQLLQAIDTTGSGTIDYTEFIAACLHQTHYHGEEACRAAFRVFDINGKGRISGTELKQVFQMAGDNQEEDSASEFLEADLDGDGEIDFVDFCNLMKRVPSRTLIGANPDDTVNMMQKVSSRSNLQHFT
eukprot:GHVS01007467.1.p1 GENE.GHVS01007467.1~~GHVS01007467.1.p1  ORF type:complete len:777 (+),score=148.79 GHVS01007467.1:281-2611(+)